MPITPAPVAAVVVAPPSAVVSAPPPAVIIIIIIIIIIVISPAAPFPAVITGESVGRERKGQCAYSNCRDSARENQAPNRIGFVLGHLSRGAENNFRHSAG